ncbi:RING-H2 finger protein ATL73-like [Lycium barbarum]|uniref:RING-H2 finger protein ATL73-like n=1 Tax=Lycium barbarum TaxID=112863 RepID=UPI00293EB408|nr:RING-H2 finger protein ATL73-like [Lycium barbarum]
MQKSRLLLLEMSIVSRFLLGYYMEVPSNPKSISSQSYNGDLISNSSCLLIVLAALLRLLLCALGLRTIIRCVLRHNGRFPCESSEAAAARLTSNGLERDELRQIRVLVYEPGRKMISVMACPICLGEFHQGESCQEVIMVSLLSALTNGFPRIHPVQLAGNYFHRVMAGEPRFRKASN